MPSKYTPQQVDQALLVLADCGESYKKAEAVCGIPTSTLHEWRTDRYRDRFEEIRERERPRLEKRAVDGAIALMLRADASTFGIFDRIDEGLEGFQVEEEDDNGNIKTRTIRASAKELAELAGAAQRLTTAKGINGTKLLELTGRPTQITEHRDGSTILRSLAQRIPGLVVDSTATDVTDIGALPEESGASNARSER